jgi:hypothetical protein
MKPLAIRLPHGFTAILCGSIAAAILAFPSYIPSPNHSKAPLAGQAGIADSLAPAVPTNVEPIREEWRTRPLFAEKRKDQMLVRDALGAPPPVAVETEAEVAPQMAVQIIGYMSQNGDEWPFSGRNYWRRALGRGWQ